MKTATEMTEKQRLAVEAMEGARSEGISLSDYAKARGLVTRELYDGIAGLRRKGSIAVENVGGLDGAVLGENVGQIAAAAQLEMQ